MPRPTKKNPSGIESFDLEHWTRLPSWRALAAALNAVVQESQEPANAEALAELPARWKQADYLAAVRHLTTALGFSDGCGVCRRANHLDGEMYTPHAVNVRETGLTGQYRCTVGHTWTCSWSLDPWW